MTNEEFEPIRIRIMKEAYDLADRNDLEGYNSIKVMCGEVQNLIKSTYRVADSFGVHYSVGDEIKKHFGIEEKNGG